MTSPHIEQAAASTRSEADARAARRERVLAANRAAARRDGISESLIAECEDSARAAFQFGDAIRGMV